MDEKTYYKQTLEELETELTHENHVLANLKGRLNKLATEGWTSLAPLKELTLQSETKKKSIEKAIEEINKELPLPAKKASSLPVKKATAKNNVPAKGEKLVCETCGLGVVVDDVTGVVLFEELVCCGKPMKLKQTPAKNDLAAPK
jgi:hypothetical protein